MFSEKSSQEAKSIGLTKSVNALEWELPNNTSIRNDMVEARIEKLQAGNKEYLM